MDDLKTCQGIASRVPIEDFKSYVIDLYKIYDLENQQKLLDTKTKISKKSIHFASASRTCEYLSQFPDVIKVLLDHFEGEDELQKKKEELQRKKEEKEEKLKKKKEEELQKKEELRKGGIIVIEDENPEDENLKDEIPAFNLPVITEQEAEIAAKCIRFSGLINFASSCYMDSVLMALFTVLEKFTLKEILRKDLGVINNNICNNNQEEDLNIRKLIQSELLELHDSLVEGRSNMKCTNFRQITAKCKGGFEDFSMGKGNNDRSASEFLQYIFRIFDVNVMVHSVSYQKIFLDGSKDKNIDEIQKIPPFWVMNPPEYRLLKETQQFVNYTTTEENHEIAPFVNGKSIYKGREITRTIYSSPIIAISLEKQIYNYEQVFKKGAKLEIKMDQTRVIPNEIINLIGGDQLILVASVIFTMNPNHYTLMLRCNNQWYYYNDLNVSVNGKAVEKIADDYESLLKAKKGMILTNAVIHFYANVKDLD